MSKQLVISLAVWCALLALPFALRPKEPGRADTPTEKLVIISAHNKSVRDEYARAFGQYYYAKHGRRIELDFRNLGGTSDIVRYIADRFEAEFRRYYEARHPGRWSRDIANAFANPAVLDDPAASAELKQARREFLASDVGIGIDLMAGGGTYDHSRHAARGFAVDGGVAKRHPEYFETGVIPHGFGGDRIYDVGGRYYGVVLSTFGICCNAMRLAGMSDPRPPETWYDLAAPRFFNSLAVADPTKSGSANKCFEIILQQAMSEAGSPEAGWAPGLNVIKRIFANARNISESASSVVRDIGDGEAAAGTAIDTYGISEHFWSARIFDGKARCFYVTPRGGTAVSADPIQLLRGAPHKAAAREFIDFLLSVEGQKLHCFKAGAPGGPVKQSLNRPPVRKDLYEPKYRPYLFLPDYNPYRSGADFSYRPKWTGKYFNLLRVLFKCIAIDPHVELVEAWRAIIAAGGPERVPEAMAEFEKLPFTYAEAAKAAESMKLTTGKTPADVAAAVRSWSDFSREHYIKAAKLAREGR